MRVSAEHRGLVDARVPALGARAPQPGAHLAPSECACCAAEAVLDSEEAKMMRHDRSPGLGRTRTDRQNTL